MILSRPGETTYDSSTVKWNSYPCLTMLLTETNSCGAPSTWCALGMLIVTVFPLVAVVNPTMVPLPFDLDVAPLKPTMLTLAFSSNDSNSVWSRRLVMVIVVPVSTMA